MNIKALIAAAALSLAASAAHAGICTDLGAGMVFCSDGSSSINLGGGMTMINPPTYPTYPTTPVYPTTPTWPTTPTYPTYPTVPRYGR